MFSVKKLFTVHNSTIKIYKPTDYTPLEFQNMSSLTTRTYISVYYSKMIDGRTSNYFGIDFSDLIRDQHFTNCSTWDELCNNLTEELAIGYSRFKIPGYQDGEYYPKNQLVTYDALTCVDDFQLAYANHHSERENVFSIRHTLHDLAIYSPTRDISNCVPIVNGLTCFPYYNEESKKLYAVGGAKLCWNQNGHITPEVQLLDFTDLGGMFISKLYWNQTDARLVSKEIDTSVFFDNNTSDELTLSERWLFKTPYSLYKYSPILVICGVLVFPDEYFIVDEYIFRVDINKLPLNKAIAIRSYFTDTTNSDSGNTYGYQPNLIKYLSTALSYPLDLSMQLFAIVVKAHPIYIVRDIVDVWCKGYVVNSYAQNGLLKNMKNGCIENYHVQQMTDRKELSIQTREDSYIIDRDFIDNQVVFTNADCIHHQREAINKSSNCEMIYVMS